jgi:uncharacterized membrane protein YraQ (UPF0718 family)
MGLIILYAITGAALIASLIADPKKTIAALKTAGKQLYRMLLPFVMMLMIISVVLTIVPDQSLYRVFVNSNRYLSMLIAAGFGSITIMPGFIAFPLAGILLGRGVTYMALSAFTTTLMMVGIITFPLEREYFGLKSSVLRNLLSGLIAFIVALLTGIFFGEIP